MKNVLVLITYILLVNLLLLGCKAEITNEGEAADAYTRGISFRVHCSKMVLVRLRDDLSRVEYTDSASEGAKKERISPKEFIGEFTYKLTEYADGSRELTCQLTDGSRQYMGQTSISSRTAYLSDNLCSVVYDLDSDATNGSFSFYWQPNNRGLTYHDDYGLTKELFVRSSECSEL